MNKDNLLKNLKLLSELEAGGAPARSWRQKNREIFLMQVKNSRTALEVKPSRTWQEQAAIYGRMFFTSVWVRRNVFRPAIIGLSSLAVVLSGWIASVSASMDSVPGDILYPLKRATEAAQLTLTAGTENKTVLQVEFAARRLDEVSKIAEDPASASNDANAQYAVQEFKDNINDVKNNLDTLKENTTSATAAAVATLVNNKTDEYATQLEKAAGTMPDSVKPNLESAQAAVAETGMKAVEVMVSHSTSAISSDELKQKLQDKIDQLTVRLNAADLKDAVSSTISNEGVADAKKSLNEAHNLLATDNLLGALEEVKNATKIVLGDSAVTATTTPVVETAPSTTDTTTTEAKPVSHTSSSTDSSTVNIQFVPDTTSLDWLEAQIMEQDFKPTDKPNEQDDISTVTQ